MQPLASCLPACHHNISKRPANKDQQLCWEKAAVKTSTQNQGPGSGLLAGDLQPSLPYDANASPQGHAILHAFVPACVLANGITLANGLTDALPTPTPPLKPPGPHPPPRPGQLPWPEEPPKLPPASAKARA